ncbi:hypothetical protein OAK75_00325 [Bacteriovoracales bacterium]|nr:hypothetical protein [Bacteriovoracales bacterium]
MNIVSYESLVRDYNESINNILRGFKPKYEYLEMWVPDSDPYKSILNLFDAAQIAGEEKICLHVGKESLESIDCKNLKAEVEKLGALKVSKNDDGEIFELFYGSSDYQNELKTREKLVLSDYNELYRDGLLGLADSPTYEGSVQEVNKGGVLIRSNMDGMSLFTEVDPEKTIIRNVSYAGVNNNVYRGLLEGLCRIIDGLPIQEASDHGVIKLEYKLRDSSKTSSVPGIVTLFNMPDEFQKVNSMVRSLLSIFREKVGYNKTKNFYDHGPSKDWRALSQDERIKTLIDCIKNFRSGFCDKKYKIELTDLQKGVKVYVSTSGDVLTGEKPILLREFEDYLQKNVDTRLELYHEEIKDLNKKRITGRF